MRVRTCCISGGDGGLIPSHYDVCSAACRHGRSVLGTRAVVCGRFGAGQEYWTGLVEVQQAVRGFSYC